MIKYLYKCQYSILLFITIQSINIQSEILSMLDYTCYNFLINDKLYIKSSFRLLLKN